MKEAKDVPVTVLLSPMQFRAFVMYLERTGGTQSGVGRMAILAFIGWTGNSQAHEERRLSPEPLTFPDRRYKAGTQ